MFKLGAQVQVTASHPMSEYHGQIGRVRQVLDTPGSKFDGYLIVDLPDEEVAACHPSELVNAPSRFTALLREFGNSVAVYGAAIFVIFLAFYGANQAQSDKSWHDATGEIGSAVPVQAPVEWQEDSLPDALYEWLGEGAQSGDLQNWGEYDGHTGCWAAVADTTLIMCPDGFTTTS